MDNVPEIFIYEDDKVEEPSLYFYVHDVCLPSFVRRFCMFRTGGFPCFMLRGTREKPMNKTLEVWSNLIIHALFF